MAIKNITNENLWLIKILNKLVRGVFSSSQPKISGAGVHQVCIALQVVSSGLNFKEEFDL